MVLVRNRTGLFEGTFIDLLDSCHFHTDDIAVFQNNSYFGQDFKTALYRFRVSLVYGNDYFLSALQIFHLNLKP